MKKEISTKGIFILCLGDFARGILYGLITSFLTLFYIPTSASSQLEILIPNTPLRLGIISIGILGILRGIGTIWDAVTDPLIANLSDRCKHKDGRRIPFMKWGCIPYAITAVLVFFPPIKGVSIVNAIWVGIMLLLYYTFSTIYNVPFGALQVELVADTKKRVFLYSVNSFLYVISSALIYVIYALVDLFKGMGIAEIWAYRIPFLFFGLLGLITGAIPAFFIKETEYVEPKDCYIPILASLKATFKYKNFTILTIGYLVMWVAFTFFNAAMPYYIQTLLGEPSSFATVVLGISIAVGVCLYPLLNKLVAKVGKKPLLLGACLTYVVLYCGIYNYVPIKEVIGSKLFGILLGLFIAFPIAITNIVPAAAFGDLATYDYVLTGEQRTGMFVAAKNFVNKLSTSIVIILATSIINLEQSGATSEYATVYGVRLTSLIAMIAVAFAVIIYSFYNDKEVVSKIDEWNKNNKEAK